MAPVGAETSKEKHADFLYSFHPKIKWSINKLKLATLVEVEPKAPFSITTTPMCRGGCYFFLLIAPTLLLMRTL